MQHKLYFAALLCGALCLTGCLKNEESPSVTQVRNAKANELESIATLNKANAEATLILANADAKLKEAEAKVKEAEAKLREADAAYRLAEAEGVKAATQLKLVEVQLKEVEVELARVNVDIKKVELEQKKAELEALKAEYEARIAAAEASKLYFESLKQVIEANLQVALLEAQAALIEAQTDVLVAQSEYEQYLKDLEKADAENYAALRDSVEHLSTNYHAAARKLINMQTKLAKKEFNAAKLENNLADAIDVKNAEIEENNKDIARMQKVIEALEAAQELNADELSDAMADLLVEVIPLQKAYQEAVVAETAAQEEYTKNIPAPIKDEPNDYDASDDPFVTYAFTKLFFTTEDGVTLTQSGLPNLRIAYPDANNQIQYLSFGPAAAAEIDEETGMSVQNLIGTHEVYASVIDYRYGDPISSEEIKEELYSWYQFGTDPWGVKKEVTRYPELSEGITADTREPYVRIEQDTYIPMTVNRDGYETYVSFANAIQEYNREYDLYEVEYVKAFAEWYLEAFKKPVDEFDAAWKDLNERWEETYEANKAAQEAYEEALTAWALANEMGNAMEIQKTLYDLGSKIEELQAFLNDPEAPEVKALEKKIKSWQKKIDAAKESMDTPEYKEKTVKLAEAKHTEAEEQEKWDGLNDKVTTAQTNYDKQKAEVDRLLAEYKDKQDAWYDARRTYASDPTDANKTEVSKAKTNMENAKDAYDAAVIVLDGPDSELEGETKSFKTLLNEAKDALDAQTPILNAAKNAVKDLEKEVNKPLKNIEVWEGRIEEAQGTIQKYQEAYEELTNTIDELEQNYATLMDLGYESEEGKAVKAAYEAWVGEEGTETDPAEGSPLAEYNAVVKEYDDFIDVYYYSFKLTNDEAYEYVYDGEEPVWFDPENIDWEEVFPEEAAEMYYNDLISSSYYYCWDDFEDGYYYPSTIANKIFEYSFNLNLYDLWYFSQYVQNWIETVYPEKVETINKKYDEAIEKNNKILERVDAVLAEEAAYKAGIEKVNELSAKLAEAQKATFDAEMALLPEEAKLEALIAAAEQYGKLQHLINTLNSKIEAVEKENEDWDDIFDETLALEKVKAKIEILKSEIEIQEAIVASWKAQLDAALAELVGAPEEEEVTPAAE